MLSIKIMYWCQFFYNIKVSLNMWYAYFAQDMSSIVGLFLNVLHMYTKGMTQDRFTWRSRKWGRRRKKKDRGRGTRSESPYNLEINFLFSIENNMVLYWSYRKPFIICHLFNVFSTVVTFVTVSYRRPTKYCQQILFPKMPCVPLLSYKVLIYKVS